MFIITDKQIAIPLLLWGSSYPRWMRCTRTYHQKPPKLCTENRFKLFPFILLRTAILQMFAAVQQQDGSVCAVPGNAQNPHPAAGKGPEPGLWILPGQTGTVIAFPPNPSLQESNSLPRHEQLNVPWAVTRVKLSCSDTAF